MQYLKFVEWAYLIIWILLLVHWIRCRNFYPVLKNHCWTKVWWGLTFLLFNPFMSLLYIVFGILLRPNGREPRHLPRSRAIVFGLSAVIIAVMDIHLMKPADPIQIVRKGDPKAKTQNGFKATTCDAKTSMSAISSKSVPGNALFDIRRIAILNDSDHPLMIKTAHLLQQALIKLPMVDEVAYYPVGAAPETGAILPSYYVRLDMPVFSRKFRPAGRVVDAVVTCSGDAFGGGRHLSFPSRFNIPTVDLDNDISIEYHGVITGVESGSAQYDDEAGSICKSITDQLVKTLTTTAEESDTLPLMPDPFYGPYDSTPAMPFEQTHLVIRKVSGCGFLIHNMTCWTYRDERPMHEALKAVKQDLEKEGWHGGDDYLDTDYPTPLDLDRDGEHLLLIRLYSPSGSALHERTASDLIMVCYVRPFSKEEIAQAARRLLDSEDADIQLLLAFSSIFQSDSTDNELRQQYEARLLAAQPGTAMACLELARIWKSKNEPGRAIDLLARANAIDQVEPGLNNARQNIEKLGKELGVEKLEDLPITDALMQSIGLIPVDRTQTNITRTVSLNQPFGFYAFEPRYRDPGSVDSLTTCTFTVIQDTVPSAQIPEQDPRSFWKMRLNIRKQYSGSQSTRTGQLENGQWTFHDEGWADQFNAQYRINVTARETDDGRIVFSAVIGN